MATPLGRADRHRPQPDAARLASERETLLEQLHEALEGVMVALSLAWVILLVVELVGGGLPPSLDAAVLGIWAIFVGHFVLEFTVAPSKGTYLKRNWLTVVSLALPALRVFRALRVLRLLRVARVTRSIGLLRILTSVNRGLASLRATAARRGVGYVLGATALVIVVGAAGMAYFESPEGAAGGQGTTASDRLADYGDALWWTAYAMSTGATSQPVTSEGRLLGWLLSLYGLGVFGYLTATLASHFVGQGRVASESGDRASVDPAGRRGQRRGRRAARGARPAPSGRVPLG